MLMGNNSREDIMDLDLNQEPLDQSYDSVIGLDIILNDLETAHEHIEERIRQLEAVTTRATQRQRWRHAPTVTEPADTAAAYAHLERHHTGDDSAAAQERILHSDKTSKKNGSHLVAKALGMDPEPKTTGNKMGSFFDCNICLDVAKDPILTCCGHLFCWSCFYQLSYVHSNAKECPECQGEVTDTSIIPIYGHGNGNRAQKSKLNDSGLKVPPRPRAQRIESMRQQILFRGASSSLIEERIQQISNLIGAMGEQSRSQNFDVTHGRSERTNLLGRRRRWAQYLLAMRYLSELTEQQTLVMYSGHPMGLFPSRPAAPRMVVTNGLMIPNYSTRAQYDKAYAMGNTQYGQMTAGSYCYIGPQGIVHGTTITVLNACRKYLQRENTRGTVYVSSGLGGMSGAQPKAGVISGVISVTAEIDESAVKKRHEQGWVDEVVSDLDACVARIREAKAKGEVVSIAYHGNVVTLWERLADEAEATGEILVELGSDQTSLHNPFNGGYYPVQLTFEESQRVMAEDPARFQELVQESLRRHAIAINRLTAKGMRFWDYGNSFLLEAQRAGADVLLPGVKPEEAAVSTTAFKYPSYVQDIMGDIFSLGFGPFRWVCTSGNHEDLKKTDAIAARVLRELLDEPEVPERVAAQLRDNLRWIEAAEENQLVVGSEARILYADRVGRGTIAMAFNAAVASGELSAPVVLSRDHHDVSGTDSPFRETSNVTDGSAFCADMAVQNALGDAARGATWIALHNGGGVGWGEVMNGGFGMVLDGSEDAREKAACMLGWDVNNGVARRAWARNANARFAIEREMKADPLLTVTLANEADDASVRDAVTKLF